MTVIIISAIAAFGTLMGVVVALYFNARKMSRDTMERMMESTRETTNIARDIRDNTQAIERATLSISAILSRLDKTDGDLRELDRWRVKTDTDMAKYAEKVDVAFVRLDERKEENHKLRDEVDAKVNAQWVEIGKLRDEIRKPR